jgi:outer membrane protein TolC
MIRPEQMTRMGRDRLSRGVRWVRRFGATGAQFGAAAVLGLGCHSVQPTVPPVAPATSVVASGPPMRPGPIVPTAAREESRGPAGAGPAIHPTGPVEETIDLGVALRLAGVDNPTISLARERVEEAVADELAARALWLPNVNVGGNYHRHHGALETSFGYIRRVDSQSLYAGFGAGSLAAESVAYPGVRLFAHLGDAVFEPLAARQRVSARVSDAVAVRNVTLLGVASAYLDLAGAEAQIDSLRQGEADLRAVLRLTEEYARAGQGRQGEVGRATARAALLARDIQLPQELAGIAAAELSRILNLDPSVRLRTPKGSVVPMRLVAEDTDPQALIAEALRSRPEVFARSADVLEARVRVRQEQVRPWVPTISAGYSYGWFGGGSNLVSPDFGPLKGRSDFDVFAVWTFQNLGFGNLARAEGADARVGQEVARLQEEVNRIRREVAEAQSAGRAAALQLEVVRPAVKVAEQGFELEKLRIREGQGRPIELLDSFRQLLDARTELIRATIAFNEAQFRLFVAVGSNPLAPAGPPSPTPR